MVIFPPALKKGDRVAVIAPSGPLPRLELLRGLAWVRARYEVRMSPGALTQAGYLAGSDERRRAELLAALEDRSVKAIIAARGGYGAMRALEGGGLEALRKHPKWIVGFSDVTALHIAALELGVASIHGPNVTGLGRALPATRAAWLKALERPLDPVRWDGLTHVHGSAGAGADVAGPVAGGNLSLLHAMAAAGQWTPPHGSVLLLEDVDERPYRIDRMLTSFRMGGHLSRVGAIVFGEHSRCNPGPDGVTVEEVLAERTRGLGLPVLCGAPFGHGPTNHAFVLGRNATVGRTHVTFQ